VRSSFPTSGERWRRTQVVASNLRYLQLLDVASEALARADVPFLYLKGAAYLDSLYPDLSQRGMCDLDCLIDPIHRNRARRALEQVGFRYIEPPPGREATWDQHYNAQFSSADGAMLELHTAFCPLGQYSIDYVAVWQRHVVHCAGERVIPTLAPEDSLIYAAIHEAKHAFDVPVDAREDIRRIIQHWQPDWSVVLQRATEWGARSSLYVMLRAARRAGADVPSAVLIALRPSPVKRVALRALLTKDGEKSRLPGTSSLVQLATALIVADDQRQNVRFLSTYAGRRTRDFLSQLSRGGTALPRLPD
jgi:hypothetical protein